MSHTTPKRERGPTVFHSLARRECGHDATLVVSRRSPDSTSSRST